MNKYSKENAVKNLAFDCKMTSNASRVCKYFCKAGHVWYTAVWYQYAGAGVSLNFSMLYATPVSPNPPAPTIFTISLWGSIILGVRFSPGLRSRLLQLVRSPSSSDCTFPWRQQSPLHAVAESSVTKQPHIVTNHFCEAQHWWCYPFKCWSRIYADKRWFAPR